MSSEVARVPPDGGVTDGTNEGITLVRLDLRSILALHFLHDAFNLFLTMAPFSMVPKATYGIPIASLRIVRASGAFRPGCRLLVLI